MNDEPEHAGAHLKALLKMHKTKYKTMADAMGVGWLSVQQICCGARRITPEMAIRLSWAIHGTTPEYWLAVQARHEIAKVRETVQIVPFQKPVIDLIRIKI